MNRKEKQDARIERYRELAKKAELQSIESYNQSHKMIGCIPLGQPILVGHHSEKAHRRLLDRSWKSMGKSVKLSDKSNYYSCKADAAENNDSIYLEDDDAIERLQEKMERLERSQSMMKAANKIIRSKKLNDAGKVEELQMLGFLGEKATELIKPGYYGEYGFPSYMLKNNNARIRDTKQRLERAKKLKETAINDYIIDNVRVVENTKDNRLQLFFPSIPKEEIRLQLKHNAFRWSRFNNCWQSYLNRLQIERAKFILQSSVCDK